MIKVAFLDVGQGDSTVIHLPDKMSAVVIDCPNKTTTFNYLRTNSLTPQAVYISHSDFDHAEGAIALLNNYEGNIKSLYINKDSEHRKKRLFLRQLVRLAEQKGINIHQPRKSDIHSSQIYQDLQIYILHPTDADLMILGSPNEVSSLLRVVYKDVAILFTADISGSGWKRIFARNENLQAHILKFPHHGAWDESIPTLLSKASAQYIVVSVGSQNSYDHPKLQTLEHLAKLPCKLMCTQVTSKCHQIDTKSRSCAGSIVALIDDLGQIEIQPSLQEHNNTIASFNSPLCRTSQ